MAPVVTVPNVVAHAFRAKHLWVTTGSPVTETFSTPPSSPFHPNSQPDTVEVIIDETTLTSNTHSLERKLWKTKPDLTHLENSDLSSAGMAANTPLGFTSPIQGGAPWPVNQQTPRSEQPTPSLSSTPTASHASDPAAQHLQVTRHRRPTHVQSPPSPCFVHSLLDQGASLRNFLELNHIPSPGYAKSTHSSGSSTSDSGRGTSLHSEPLSERSLSNSGAVPVGGGPAVGVARILDPRGSHHGSAHSYGEVTDSDLSPSEGEDEGNSLTRQLAETAVGVRELSKQLGMYILSIPPCSQMLIFRRCPGRARVRTNIQSVLIVTKARDNRLIQLTRELAIYLMQKKSGDNDRGLIVCVICLTYSA